MEVMLLQRPEGGEHSPLGSSFSYPPHGPAPPPLRQLLCEGPQRLAQPNPLSLKTETKAPRGRDWPEVGQPARLPAHRQVPGPGGRVNAGSRGGKCQNVIGLIKGLVSEPFRPGQGLGTSREPSSPISPLANVVLS